MDKQIADQISWDWLSQSINTLYLFRLESMSLKFLATSANWRCFIDPMSLEWSLSSAIPLYISHAYRSFKSKKADSGIMLSNPFIVCWTKTRLEIFINVPSYTFDEPLVEANRRTCPKPLIPFRLHLPADWFMQSIGAKSLYTISKSISTPASTTCVATTSNCSHESDELCSFMILIKCLRFSGRMAAA